MKPSFVITFLVSFGLAMLAYVLFERYGNFGDDAAPETTGPQAYAEEQ